MLSPSAVTLGALLAMCLDGQGWAWVPHHAGLKQLQLNLWTKPGSSLSPLDAVRSTGALGRHPCLPLRGVWVKGFPLHQVTLSRLASTQIQPGPDQRLDPIGVSAGQSGQCIPRIPGRCGLDGAALIGA